MLAPVVIFVYDRLHHLGMTVNALKNNELAQETKLFIYSDKELIKGVKRSVKQAKAGKGKVLKSEKDMDEYLEAL